MGRRIDQLAERKGKEGWGGGSLRFAAVVV